MTIAGIVLSTQLLCLTTAIYEENRDEHMPNWTPQIKIAAVIHNRMLSESYPDSYCGVINQPYQFSFVHLRNDLSMPDKKAREKAFRAAYAVYTYNVDGQPAVLFGGITHYHADYVEPTWSQDERIELRYYDGYHLFYTSQRVRF